MQQSNSDSGPIVQRSNSDSGPTAKRSILKTRLQNNKEQIFCEWRHRWVRLTPEEWVRQQLLHRMVEELHYPGSRIGVEVPLEKLSIVQSNGTTAQRVDAVIYDRTMKPHILIECKADTVPLTQKTLDQAIAYNRKLGVPYLLLHNGPQSVFVDLRNETPAFSATIPPFQG